MLDLSKYKIPNLFNKFDDKRYEDLNPIYKGDDYRGDGCSCGNDICSEACVNSNNKQLYLNVWLYCDGSINKFLILPCDKANLTIYKKKSISLKELILLLIKRNNNIAYIIEYGEFNNENDAHHDDYFESIQNTYKINKADFLKISEFKKRISICNKIFCGDDTDYTKHGGLNVRFNSI